MRNPCLSLIVLLCCAGGASAATVTISHPYLRALPGGLPAAGYFDLLNAGDRQVVLTGASAPACGSLMLHKSTTEGGMARMADVSSVRVPPHGTISFQPGGYHLMCMNPRGLAAGGTAKVTLKFEGGATLAAVFAVTGVRGP